MPVSLTYAILNISTRAASRAATLFALQKMVKVLEFLPAPPHGRRLVRVRQKICLSHFYPRRLTGGDSSTDNIGDNILPISTRAASRAATTSTQIVPCVSYFYPRRLTGGDYSNQLISHLNFISTRAASRAATSLRRNHRTRISISTRAASRAATLVT